MTETKLPNLGVKIKKIDAEQHINNMLRDVQGPALHIGSKIEILDKWQNWREACSGIGYYGIDIVDGPGVDFVCDITMPVAKIRKILGVKTFGLIIAPHLLEHVRKPWIAAKNIQKLMAQDGKLFVSVPWVQAYHDFPADYWRFSFSGLAELFDDIHFLSRWYSGTNDAIGFQIVKNESADFSMEHLRLESNLFQIVLEHQPAQNVEFEDNIPKFEISTGFMPIMAVNAIGEKLKTR